MNSSVKGFFCESKRTCQGEDIGKKLNGYLTRCRGISPGARLNFFDEHNNAMVVDADIEEMIKNSFSEKFPHIFLFNGSDNTSVWREIHDALEDETFFQDSKVYGRPVSSLFCQSDELTKWLDFVQADEARIQAAASLDEEARVLHAVSLISFKVPKNDILNTVSGITDKLFELALERTNAGAV